MRTTIARLAAEAEGRPAAASRARCPRVDVVVPRGRPVRVRAAGWDDAAEQREGGAIGA